MAASPIWDEVELLPDKKWRCPFCRKEFTGNASRVRAHLGGLRVRPTGGRYGIGCCTFIPPVERARILETYAATAIASASAPATASTPHGATASTSTAAPMPPPSDPHRPSASSVSSSSHPRASSQPSTSRGTRQTIMPGSLREGHHEEATRHIAQMFYDLNLPFIMASSRIFRETVSKIAVCGPGYTPPTPDALRGPLLQERITDVRGSLVALHAAWDSYGCSIMADGWTDHRKRPLINIIVSSCYGSMFLRSVDASEAGRVHTTKYIYSIIREAIQEVGPQRVVQVVTDSASNCRRMGDLLMAEYPSIVWTPCAAHSLDLLLHSIGRLPWVSELLRKALAIVDFITRKRRITALFRTFSKLDLKKPAPTRFAYQFLMLERLHRLKGDLRRMATSAEFTAMDPSQTPEGLAFYDILFMEPFWFDMQQLMDVMRPMYSVLRLVDREGCTMGLIYEFMDRIGESLARSDLDATRLAPIRRLWQRRWEKFHRPIHSVAHILHPLWQSDRQYRDEELHADWFSYIHLLDSDVVHRSKLEDQRLRFRDALGLFGEDLARMRGNRLRPVSWWESYGTAQTELRRLALRVLSQDCSACVCERNWSAFSLVHTNRRNRLTQERCNDLVYCNTNTRVVRRIADSMRAGGARALLLQVNPDDCMVAAADPKPEPEVDADEAARRALQGDPEDDPDAEETAPLPTDVPLPSSSDDHTYDSDETVDIAGDVLRAPPTTPATETLDDDGWAEAAREAEAAAQRHTLTYDGSQRVRQLRTSQASGSQSAPRGRGRPPGKSVPQRVPSGRPRGRPSKRARTDDFSSRLLVGVGPDLEDS